jgi:hypothetical protein
MTMSLNEPRPGKKEGIDITIPENQKAPLRCFIFLRYAIYYKCHTIGVLRHMFLLVFTHLSKFKCVERTNPEI